ncbi:GNAT family N-acetyltransferase [Streptomyces populi]
MKAAREYLRRAASAGLAGEAAGFGFVADRCDDPFTGRRQILVEYCSPGLPASPAALDALRGALRARDHEADAVLLRVDGDLRLPAPWRPRLTYVRHDRDPAAGTRGAPSPAGLTVRPAARADDARVHDWLVQAFRNAYPGQEIASEHPGVADIMAAPDRLSFIAELHGEPIGHGTVLISEQDSVTGEEFTELVDTLVDDARHRRAAVAALVAAAVEAAGGRPLCGHVVHPYEPGAARAADNVLRALVAGDWSVDHCFWESPW